MARNLGEQNSIFNRFVAEIRDKEMQRDSMRFRRNLERIGEVFALEISKELDYEAQEVSTPLGSQRMQLLKAQPVIATILRAGLPLQQGLLNYFDRAESAFVSAYRNHKKDGSFEVLVEYLSAPSLDGKVLILCDPMLATGASIVLSYRALLKHGTPAHTHLVCAVASKEGVQYVEEQLPEATLWVGAVDEALNAQAYIVPGLGDAGDLAFGVKE